MVIKLDMSKDYDRVEWRYLEGIMRAIGFSERWISIVMSCVTTMTYFVLVNGKAGGSIIPIKGVCVLVSFPALC